MNIILSLFRSQQIEADRWKKAKRVTDEMAHKEKDYFTIVNTSLLAHQLAMKNRVGMLVV